jgi:hypothetical protein
MPARIAFGPGLRRNHVRRQTRNSIADKCFDARPPVKRKFVDYPEIGVWSLRRAASFSEFCGGKLRKPLQSERKISRKPPEINKTPPNFRSIWSGGY